MVTAMGSWLGFLLFACGASGSVSISDSASGAVSPASFANLSIAFGAESKVSAMASSFSASLMSFSISAFVGVFDFALTSTRRPCFLCRLVLCLA